MGQVDNVASDMKGRPMAKATVEVLVDDLDGSDGAETVRIGWDGQWRELELSKRNRAALSRTLEKYWKVGRPVAEVGSAPRRRRAGASSSRSSKPTRDPKQIRAWAIDNGIAIPARGRIPAEVKAQYERANAGS